MILLLLLISVVFSSPKAVVSVYPFYDVVREVGKGKFETEVLLPPRADYHFYELSASDMIKLARAKIVFVSGIPLGGWERKVEEVAGNRAYRLSKGIDLLYYKEHRNLGKDSHIWLSPKRMKIVARNAYEGFLSVDAEGRKTFERNLEEVNKRLEELDWEFKRLLSSCRLRVLPVVHPALGYLAKDYGLEQISLTGGDVHGGVSPRELMEFLKELKRKRIDFVFTVLGSRSKLAELLSREYGLRVFEINVKIVPTESSKDYFSIMRENLKILKEALRCM